MNIKFFKTKTVNDLAFLIPVFFLMMALWLVIFPIKDNDTFWHLANGLAMLDQGRIINEEIFSYSAFGNQFPNHSWLAQIILALFYLAGGINGLIFYKVLMAGGIFFFVFKICRNFDVSKNLSAAAAFLVILTGLYRYVVRPQLFSYLGLAILFWIISGFLKGRLSKRYLYLLPALIVVWDFTHGAIYGLVLWGAVAAGETMKLFFRGKFLQWQAAFIPTRGKVCQLWIWFAIAVIAALAKPNGVELYKVIFRIVGDNNFIFAMTAEFLPTGWTVMMLPFWGLLILTLSVIMLNWRRVDFTHLVILVPFVYLGLRYNRCVAIFAIVTAPLWALYGQQLFSRERHLGQAIKTCYLLMIFAALSWTVYIKLPNSETHLDATGFRTGLGINRAYLPIGVTEFIKTADLQGNMFNTDRFGGLLAFHLYPERRIFHFNHPTIFKEIYEYLHNPDARDKWEQTYAVVAKPIEINMFKDRGWLPVYHDPAVMVMVDPKKTDSKIISQYSIEYFDPLMSLDQARRYLGIPQVAKEFLQEIANYLRFNEDPNFCVILAEGTSAKQPELDAQKKIDLLTTALSSNPDDSNLLNVLGLLYIRERNPAAAKTYLERAETSGNFSQARSLNLGFVYLQLKNYVQAEKQFSKLLKKDRDDADAVFGMALSLQGQNQQQQAQELFEKYLSIAPQGRFSQRAKTYLQQTSTED